MEETKTSLPRTIFGMMVNPSATLRGALAGTRWYFSVAVPAAAFGLFFLQTGLDLYRTGQKGFSFVLMSCGAGLAYGLVVIPLLAVVMWIFLKVAKTGSGLLEAVSAFCLSYSGALVYGVLGLVFSLTLGWKTAVAFGVTGVLWATGPLMFTIRELTGGKTSLSVPLSTAVSAVVLLTWTFFGNL